MLGKLLNTKRWLMGPKIGALLAVISGLLVISSSLFGFWYGQAMAGQRITLGEIWTKLAPGLPLFVLVLSLGLVLAICSSLIIVKKLIEKPLRQLDQATRKVSVGELDFQLTPFNYDELGQLTAAFNSMLSQLQQMLKTVAAYSRNLAATQQNFSSQTYGIATTLEDERKKLEQITSKASELKVQADESLKLAGAAKVVPEEAEELYSAVGELPRHFKTLRGRFQELISKVDDLYANRKANLTRINDLSTWLEEQAELCSRLNDQVLEAAIGESVHERLYYQIEELTRGLNRSKQILQRVVQNEEGLQQEEANKRNAYQVVGEEMEKIERISAEMLDLAGQSREMQKFQSKNIAELNDCLETIGHDCREIERKLLGLQQGVFTEHERMKHLEQYTQKQKNGLQNLVMLSDQFKASQPDNQDIKQEAEELRGKKLPGVTF